MLALCSKLDEAEVGLRVFLALSRRRTFDRVGERHFLWELIPDYFCLGLCENGTNSLHHIAYFCLFYRRYDMKADLVDGARALRSLSGGGAVVRLGRPRRGGVRHFCHAGTILQL